MTQPQELSRMINEYYQKGLTALEKKNYDYAIEMLLQVVIEEPLFVEARQDLHRAEREKCSARPPSVLTRIITKINNAIPYCLALFYEARKDNEKAIAFYEDLLKSEPSSKLYLKKIANLALKNNWVDVGIVALESLHELDPENVNIIKELGRLYRDKQDVEHAAFYLKRSLEIDPHDQKTAKALKDLDALHTIQTGGWEKTGSFRGKIKDEEQAAKLEQEARKAGLAADVESQVTALKQKIRADQNNIKLWVELIDVYLATNNMSELAKIFASAQPAFLQHEQVQNRLIQYKKKCIMQDIASVETQLSRTPHDQTLLTKKKELTQKLINYEQEVLEKKVTLYPNDLSLKYDLGEVYFKQGDYDKSIAELQQAIKDPALAVKALNKLGTSFHHKGMYDLAVLQFNKALDKVPGMNETAKDILYNLGTTLEAMGKKEEAVEKYKKIYEVDISYRDIAQKIESFYQK